MCGLEFTGTLVQYYDSRWAMLDSDWPVGSSRAVSLRYAIITITAQVSFLCLFHWPKRLFNLRAGDGEIEGARESGRETGQLWRGLNMVFLGTVSLTLTYFYVQYMLMMHLQMTHIREKELLPSFHLNYGMGR